MSTETFTKAHQSAFNEPTVWCDTPDDTWFETVRLDASDASSEMKAEIRNDRQVCMQQRQNKQTGRSYPIGELEVMVN